MPALTPSECLLLLLAATSVGFSKSGFAGVGMLHVLLFAFVFGAKASTGVLLPMLVIGDCCAIVFFGKSAQWDQVRRLLPPSLVGVVLGTLLMGYLQERTFKPLVGAIILGLTSLQVVRIWRPDSLEKLPHSMGFAWALGLLAGVTTMMANAAGPVFALYVLAVGMPKLQFVGTSAWFFLVLNVFKLPFSYGLGLIDAGTLAINAVFSPAILLGMLGGRWLIHRIPQKLFDSFLLAFTAAAALRLLLSS